MPQTVTDALQQTTFITTDDTYRLIKMPANAISAAAGIIAQISEPFCVLIVDQHEVTLLIPDDAVEDFTPRMRDYELGETYRLITADATLEPDLLGFIAAVSTALADAEVGVFPYAAYTRDHILVPATQLERALKTLNTLKAQHTG